MEKTAVDFNKVVGKEALTSVLKFLVLTLTRRISDDGEPGAVSNRAQQVAERIKGNKSVYLEAGLRKTCEMLGFNPILLIAGMVGTEAYSEAVVAASRNLAVRRRDRSAARKAYSVT